MMLKDYSIFFSILVIACQTSYAANNAQFISQSIPSTMEPGQTYQVSVTFKNTGTTTWTEASSYRLGVQNAQDNGNWVTGRVYIGAGESIAPGQSKTFTFSVTSPLTPGKYNFQWQMVQEYVQWFGDYSTNVVVPVKNYALMEKVKKKGCIFEGILSSADTDGPIAMLDRSQCEYLHRSIETWAYPPDFSLIQTNLNKIHKAGIIHGMFIAEAINTTATYYYPDEGRYFNFASMCAAGTTGQWGANTCIPSFKTAEYRKYVGYITKKAIDMGIVDFGFGQIYLMENTGERSHLTSSYAPQIVLEMRQYARSKGKTIIVGAQSNDISDEAYLRNFDYIWGGVGEDISGNIETGTCSSKFSGCWALLWHDYWASKANDVLIHFDWYSYCDDDMNVFTRMTTAVKEQFLREKYNYFVNTKGMSFIMPFMGTPLDGNCRSPCHCEATACFGQNAWSYSADPQYSCRDEDIMNYVLSGASSVTVSGTVRKSTGQGISGVLIDMCGGLSAQTNSSGIWSTNVPFGQAYCARIASGLPGGYSMITGVNNTNCNTGSSTYEWQYAGKDVFQSCSYSDQRSWDLPAAKDAGINFIVSYPATTTTTTTTTTRTTTTTTTTSTTRTTTTTTSTTASSTSTTTTTSSTSNTSSTTTTSRITTSTSTSTTTTNGTSNTSATTTTQPQCIMPGNYPPCNDVTLSEVVNAINRWAAGEYDLWYLIDLIDSWANPISYPAT